MRPQLNYFLRLIALGIEEQLPAQAIAILTVAWRTSSVRAASLSRNAALWRLGLQRCTHTRKLSPQLPIAALPRLVMHCA